MPATTKSLIQRRAAGDNVWLGRVDLSPQAKLTGLPAQILNYEVLESEDAVGRAMLEEFETAARE